MTVLIARAIVHLRRGMCRVCIDVRVLVALDGRISGGLCRDCRSSGFGRLCGLCRRRCAIGRFIGVITKRSELSVQTVLREDLGKGTYRSAKRSSSSSSGSAMMLRDSRHR